MDGVKQSWKVVIHGCYGNPGFDAAMCKRMKQVPALIAHAQLDGNGKVDFKTVPRHHPDLVTVIEQMVVEGIAGDWEVQEIGSPHYYICEYDGKERLVTFTDMIDASSMVRVVNV
jgi:uncharacterized protein YjaZ